MNIELAVHEAKSSPMFDFNFVFAALEIDVLLLGLHPTAVGMYAFPARMDFFRQAHL
jgi:hypothetical protein